MPTDLQRRKELETMPNFAGKLIALADENKKLRELLREAVAEIEERPWQPIPDSQRGKWLAKAKEALK
jgi:hypothetical protein